MTTLTCKQCAIEITTPPNHTSGQPLVCPACRAVFNPPNQDGQPLSPPVRGLPSKMSLTRQDDALILTQRSGGWGYAALGGLVSFMLGYGLLFGDFLLVEFLFNPLTWFMIGLAYFSLRKVINRSEVRLNSQRLQIKHGPLPPWQNRRFDVQNINQLYVKQRIEKSNKSSTTHYDLYLTPGKGPTQAVLTGLESAEQALFLEQEIERHLGLKDRAMPGDYAPARTYKFSGWERFAEVNQLAYTPGKLPEGYQVEGHYQGYAVELITEPAGLDKPAKTRLTLTGPAERPAQPDAPAASITLNQVADLLLSPARLAWAGKFKAVNQGAAFRYELDEVETDHLRLQVVLDTLVALGEAYPQIIALGSEVIPLLQPVAATKAHPAQAVAARLIQAIAPSTDLLRLGDPTLLLCKRCLTRCTDHRAALPWTPDVPYFGCRRCHQSREFFKVEQVVALLDEEAEARPQQQGSTLSVPWRPGQPLFDFDTVIIRQASDETVERFAVQLGNDTDPFRQPRTREMRCVIAPSCHLSANTQRILQRTFAQVAVESISTPSREDTPATREAVDRLTEAESREEQSRRD